MGSVWKWMKGFGNRLRHIWRRFSTDNGMTLAGALSFYFLMSVLPLSLLALSILGFILGSERAALSAVTSLGKIGKILPRGALDIESILASLIQGKGVIGGLGIVMLLWFSAGVFFTLEVSINKIFRSGKKRGFFHRTAVVYFFMLVAGGLLFMSIAITVLAAVVSDLSVSLLGINPAEIPLLWNLVFSLVPPALIMLLFVIIYKVGPTNKVRWKAAFRAGFWGALLWEISRRIFGWYLSNLALYNKLYGTLGTLVGLLIWIFYTANILLLGAEIAAISNKRMLASSGDEPEDSPGEDEETKTMKKSVEQSDENQD